MATAKQKPWTLAELEGTKKMRDEGMSYRKISKITSRSLSALHMKMGKERAADTEFERTRPHGAFVEGSKHTKLVMLTKSQAPVYQVRVKVKEGSVAIFYTHERYLDMPDDWKHDSMLVYQKGGMRPR